MKVISMTTAFFRFLLFHEDPLLSSSWLVAYVYTFLTGVETGRFTSWKTNFIFWKLIILRFNVQGGGQLYASFLFYILIILAKCLGFHFLSLGMHIYFPILKGVEKG